MPNGLLREDSILESKKNPPMSKEELIEHVRALVNYRNASTIDTIKLEDSNEQTKIQLQQADDTAIELYEANMILEEVNAAQDDALIELYEMIGG